MPNASHPHYRYIQDRWLIKQNDQWQQYHIPVALTTNHKEVIQTACIQGLGLALLPDWVVYESLKKGEIVRILPQFESSIHEQPRTIVICTPKVGLIIQQHTKVQIFYD
ncbi:LysR substrate-binding domain-containing protein [Gallibacterium anatis]|uniref:LysR substrate-binding domain-containing protein n=1 Tax=Gallibacterium anatis TaxID=750 RepID=UPI00037D20E7|nr:LysR substrate-binding domain-containing protein [Gallibacterium anatis]KGQ54189.1 hypothetical protein IE01_10180 [Gallibacterium anatis DSM 16844 = F 149]